MARCSERRMLCGRRLHNASESQLDLDGCCVGADTSWLVGLGWC